MVGGAAVGPVPGQQAPRREGPRIVPNFCEDPSTLLK